MLQAYQSRDELSFRLFGDLFGQIKQWTYSIDERIFNDQLATGRFLDYELDQDTLALMRHVKEQGGILPYYGVGGSGGVCSYHLHFLPAEAKLMIVHEATKEPREFLMPYTILTAPFEPRKARRFKFSPFPYLINEKLPAEWSGQPPETLDCRILGREFEKLARWEDWVEALALSGEYIYEFGEVSIGVTGFAVKVHHVKTGHVIDITDYENW